MGLLHFKTRKRNYHNGDNQETPHLHLRSVSNLKQTTTTDSYQYTGGREYVIKNEKLVVKLCYPEGSRDYNQSVLI